MNGELFDKGPTKPVEKVQLPAKPRLREIVRNQGVIRTDSLDDLLEPDHRARIVWAAVSRFDLSAWEQKIRAVEGSAGRDTTPPQLLLALWIYATTQGVSSARELARLCEKHLAYQWLCGGMSVNYHTLSDFRSQDRAAWDDLLTRMVASLLHQGLIELEEVAQDGMRVRANAGKASFRRRKTLNECLTEARERVEKLKEMENNPELSAAQKAAQERAAREREERVLQAVMNCDELQQKREARSKTTNEKVKEARASTTDPEARTMKFANGGYAPGVNVQFSTTVGSGVIVGVDVVNEGSDGEQSIPMLDQTQRRYGQTPKRLLIDGGFATKDAITEAELRGCTVYTPLKEEAKQLKEGKDPYAAKKGDSPAVASWRKRMGTEDAKEHYKLRCQTAEWVNAVARNHGLQQMPVRGLEKCRNVALLHAITHNTLRTETLLAQAAMKTE